MLNNASKMKNLLQGIDYRVARSRQELEDAYRLVFREYLKEGYVQNSDSGMRLSLHNVLPATTTFVAVVEDNTVIATATVFPDSPLRLPMDELYNKELDVLRDQGKMLCEVGMLAVDRDLMAAHIPMLLNAKKMFMVFFLFKHIFDYVQRILKCDEICITVNPKHGSVYEMLKFKNIGQVKKYNTVNGAPAIAKILEVHAVEQEIAAAGQGGLYKMFFSQSVSDESFCHKASFTFEDLKYFFVDKVKALPKATPDQKVYIDSQYPDYDLSAVIK